MRYEGKCGADSAHANHSENEPSMKGLIWMMLEVNVNRLQSVGRATLPKTEILQKICTPNNQKFYSGTSII